MSGGLLDNWYDPMTGLPAAAGSAQDGGGYSGAFNRVGQWAERASKAISPWGLMSATDVASFLPGGGVTQAATENFPKAREAYQQGQYGTAAREGLSGLLGSAGDAMWAAGPVVGATAGTGLKAAGKAVRPEAKAAQAAAGLLDAPKAAHPVLGTDPRFTGSMNPLDNVPFTFQGKSPGQWTPDEFKQVGDAFGVPNLGPASLAQKFRYQDGGEFSIPGGLDGTFTYHDMLQLKAQGIDPSKIDRDLHTQIQNKILRSVQPAEVNDAKVWDGLIFGMTSPNNPLFPNQLAQSRLRLRDPKMLDDLGGMISWKAGETVPAEVRAAASDKIANAFGLDAASKGGLGVRGSTDYTRIAELAQMFKQDPDFFRKSPNEGWDQFVERVSSQVAGLSMKTGSFGSVWQDPANAAISAIDRHMAQQFEKTGGLFRDEAQRAAWEKRAVERWNKTKGNEDRQVDNFYQLRQTPGSEGHIGGMLLEYVGDAKTPKFRMAPKKGSNSGEGPINPALPEHLRDAKWVVEPENVFKMGEAYKRALDINDQIARQHGLGLFGSQWMEWDRIRRRMEPHENMMPGLEKLPAMSVDQLRAVDAEHRASGHKNYTKVDEQGRKLKDIPDGQEPAGGVFLQPTKPRSNAAGFGYFALPPLLAVPAARGLLSDQEEQRRGL